MPDTTAPAAAVAAAAVAAAGAPVEGDRDAAARASLTRLRPASAVERRRSMQALLRVITATGGDR